MIIKTRKNDWLVEVTYITEDYEYVVKHINVYNSIKDEVLRYAQSFVGSFVVHVYKLEAML